MVRGPIKYIKGTNMNFKQLQLLDMRKAQKVNHILHLLLSIITAGAWVIMWILLVLNASLKINCIDDKLEKAETNSAVSATIDCFILW